MPLETTLTSSGRLAMIVAVSENSVIGDGGNLPWHLPADLIRFKRITMGHPIIMGRRTFESIGRLLPGRTTVIVTRRADFQQPGAVVVNSIEKALAAVKHEDLSFVIGGGEIYQQFLAWVTRVFVTRVHAEVPGDTFFPDIGLDNPRLWNLVESETHPPDERNLYSYTFQTYQKLTSDDS